MTDNKFDVIVIGAGYGGVTVAAKLSSQGFRVLIIDKNKTAGGKAMRVHKNGAVFDLWPIAGGPSMPSRFDDLIRLLGLSKDLIIRPKPVTDFSYWAKDGKRKRFEMTATVPRNPLILKQMADGYDVKPWQVGGLLRMAGVAALMPSSLLYRYDDMSMFDFLMRYNLPDPFMAFFCTLMNLFFVVPVDQVPVSEAILTLKDVAKGGAGRYHKFGYGDIAEKAVKYVEKNNGQYISGTRVDKILVENNKAVGVSTKDGDYRAPVIISNAGIQPTVLKLAGKEHFNKTYTERVAALEPSLAFVGLRYYLKKPVIQYPMTVSFSDNSWFDKARFKAAEKGTWPDPPLVFATVPALYDPALATNDIPQTALIGTISSPDPESPMNKTAIEKLEAGIEKLWPEINDHTIEKHAADAHAVSAMTRDSVVPGQGGECIGLGQVIGQCDKTKPDPKTPLPGLYLVGADAGGHGIGTTQAVDSGFNVAELVYKAHSKNR